MLHPSYQELMERINKDVEEGNTPIVQSRYSIVKATADRAKQIIAARSIENRLSKDLDNHPNAKLLASMDETIILRKGRPLTQDADEDKKPLSLAVEELYEGSVKIAEFAEDSDDYYEDNSVQSSDLPESENKSNDEASNIEDIKEDE